MEERGLKPTETHQARTRLFGGFFAFITQWALLYIEALVLITPWGDKRKSDICLSPHLLSSIATDSVQPPASEKSGATGDGNRSSAVCLKAGTGLIKGIL